MNTDFTEGNEGHEDRQEVKRRFDALAAEHPAARTE